MPARRLTERLDKRYQVTLELGCDEKGKRLRKYFYGSTQKEADAKKKAYLEGIKEIKTEPMTIEKWAKKFREVYNTGGVRNRANNESILNKFVEYINEGKKLADIKPVDIQQYARSQSEYTKSHVNKVRRVLDRLFETAVQNNYLAASPCKGIVWDSKRTGTHRVLEADLKALLTDHWRIHTAGKWSMLILYAGLRPSEAFALDRRNITKDFIRVTDGSHFEHGRLVIVPGQAKSEAGQREIPILQPLREVIKTFPDEGLVCVNTKGEPVSEASARANWAALWNMLEEIYNGREPRGAGRRSDRFPPDWKYLPKVQMYDLRHTFCSMLYDADVDVKTAQYLMGHATLDMTLKIYTHLSEAKKQRSYDKLFKYVDVNSDVKNPENP